MQDHIFRMYDIRGIVGKDLLLEDVVQIATAFSFHLFKKDPESDIIIVAMDGRTHSPDIKEAFVNALQHCGHTVFFIGICPTPILVFALYCMNIGAGCMITASHNPKEYNGFKLFSEKKPLFDEEIQLIKGYATYLNVQGVENEPGFFLKDSFIPDYILFLKKLFPHLVGCSLPIVFDCGNGATGAVLPGLCEAFEFSQATILYADIDGNYPNHDPDPSVEENMEDLKTVVLEKGAVVGIAFDGDGDRMAAVTHQGNFVGGDHLLAIFSEKILSAQEGAMIVGDIKCSSALKEYVENRSGKMVISRTGSVFVRDAMEETGAVVGGELSCHFFFKDRYFGFDDGIYAALRLIEILVESDASLEELVDAIPKRVSSPEFRIECLQDGKKIIEKVLEKVQFLENAEIISIDGIAIRICEGWSLIRLSNTQPVLSIRFESETVEGLNYCKNLVIDLLKEWYNDDMLRMIFYK